MGKLMSAVRPKVVDRADENLVSQIVKEYLNSKYKKRTQCKLSSFFFIFVIEKLDRVINSLFFNFTDKITNFNVPVRTIPIGRVHV